MNEYDRRHVWHPYTSITDPLPTYEVVGAEGVRIRLKDGRELVDGMASWWCAIHGYNHPALNDALATQASAFSHVMFGGFTHAPAVDLAHRLVDITPEGLDAVFFSDSGSVSVEVALKMAIQYWHNLGRPERHKLLTIRGGYHGDTFGAMSVCDPETGMHGLFTGTLPQQHFAPRPGARFGEPGAEADLAALRSVLEAHAHEIAALILEPIVQGAGGMWFYSADYLRGAAELCRETDTLLIFDEIATGFGRTGELFAAHHAGVSPDILCVGKALTGGYPEPGRDPRATAGCRPASRRTAASSCTGPPSWATRSPARWPARASTCFWLPRGSSASPTSKGVCVPGSSATDRIPRWPTCAASAPSASSRRTDPSTWPPCRRCSSNAGHGSAPSIASCT